MTATADVNLHSCYRPEYRWSVYVIFSAGLYKIGIAESTRRRVRNLRNSSAVPVKHVAHAIVCCQLKAREIERRLHQRFESKRRHGEWFKLNEHDIFHITEMTLKSNWVDVRRRRRDVVNRERKLRQALAIGEENQRRRSALRQEYS